MPMPGPIPDGELHMNEPTPKDLLSRKDLLGFTRRAVAGDQVAFRASSAKVFLKTNLRPTVDREAAESGPSSSDQS